MIEYKHYDRSYEDEVLKVFTASFVDYPLFWGVFEDRFKSEIKLRNFHERLMKGIFKATIRKNDCYMGIVDGKVNVVVIVEKPSDKPIGFWDFLIPLVKLSGGNLITVTTNSEKNVAFYINNGFKLIKEERLKYNEKSIGNWTFKMEL